MDQTWALPDGQATFATLQNDAERGFDVSEMEAWLEAQLHPHEVEFSHIKAKPVDFVPESQIDAQTRASRKQAMKEKYEESVRQVRQHGEVAKHADTEIRCRILENELATRERLLYEHRAKEAGLLTSLRNRSGVLRTEELAWTVEWEKTPQQFRINVSSIRGMRNKLVRDGYAVLRVAVVDRVGGSTYRLRSSTSFQECSSASPPFPYEAVSTGCDVYLNHRADMMCPAPTLLQTPAVLLFELWQLRAGKYDPVDKVVGFGYWPLVDKDFHVREGRFLVPLVLGETLPTVDTFRQINDELEHGLHHWLANVYFEVSALHRLQTNDDHLPFAVDGVDQTTDYIRNLRFPRIQPRLFFGDVSIKDASEKLNAGTDAQDLAALLRSKQQVMEKELFVQQKEAVSRKRRAYALEVQDEEDVLEIKIRMDLARHGVTKRTPADFRVHHSIHGTELEHISRDSHVLLRHHRFAQLVQREFFFLGRRVREKLRIAGNCLLDDIGVNRSGPFNKTSLVLHFVLCLAALYVRMVVHSVAKYLFLAALDVPLSKEEWNFYHFDLRFEHTSRFYAWDTIGVLAVGFAATIVVFALIALWLFLLINIFGQIPYLFTRFTLWFAVATFLDPVITSISELASGNSHSGDPFLLHNQFQREEGNGIHGVLLTLVLYGCMEMIHCVVVYGFVVFVHLNGRAEDTFARLNYPESSYFVPHDLEVSALSLRELARAAHKYRNERGDINRVVIREIHEKFTCMFRERLFLLLKVSHSDNWLDEYVGRVSLRRPPLAKAHGLIRDNLGTFTVTKDLLRFLQRNFPHLTSRSWYRILDEVDADSYYEDSLLTGISSHMSSTEDDKEMRTVLRHFFHIQMGEESPVAWHDTQPGSFILKDPQSVADLIFFETGSMFDFLGPYMRFRLLAKYISDFLDVKIEAIHAENASSWGTCSLPHFDRQKPDEAVQDKEVAGVMIYVTLDNPARNTKKLLRSFIVTPYGQILEPNYRSFSLMRHHTADYPEFWALRALKVAAEYEKELKGNHRKVE